MIKSLITNISKSVNMINTKATFQMASTKLSQPKKENEDYIANLLRSHLDATYVNITDTTVEKSNCGTMFKMTIESPRFENKSKVEQHQMVTDALKEKMNKIHGFNLKTIVPSEKKQSKNQPNKTKN